jgi:hypothetical protein
MTRVLITAMPTITTSNYGKRFLGNPAQVVAVAVRVRPDKICILHDPLPSYTESVQEHDAEQDTEPNIEPASAEPLGESLAHENAVDIQKALDDIEGKMGVAVEFDRRAVELDNPAKTVVGVIDIINQNDGAEIVLDITAIERQKWGMLYASFACADSIHEVVCLNPDHTICIMPKINFGLTQKQKALLKAIEQTPDDQKKQRTLSSAAQFSRAMYYNALQSLRNKGLVEKNALKLTAVGKAARVSYDQLGNSA